MTGVLSGWAINQGYNIGWNQLKEFTPDLSAYMKRHSKKKKKATQVAGPAARPLLNPLIVNLLCWT